MISTNVKVDDIGAVEILVASTPTGLFDANAITDSERTFTIKALALMSMNARILEFASSLVGILSAAIDVTATKVTN